MVNGLHKDIAPLTTNNTQDMCCTVCTHLTSLFPDVSQLTGSANVQFFCNASGCNFSGQSLCASLISESAFAVHLVTDVPAFLSVLALRQPQAKPYCVLLPAKLTQKSAVRSALSSTAVCVKSYATDTLLAQLSGSKPSQPMLLYHVNAASPVAVCPALSQSATPLTMVFTGRVKHVQLRTLFDSGATHSCMSHAQCKALGLYPSASALTHVTTANGTVTAVLGSVTFQIRWGPISTFVSVLVLPDFVAGLDLIVGEDFLSQHRVILDYGVGKATLSVGHKTTSVPSVAQSTDSQSGTSLPSYGGVVSSAQAMQWIRKGSRLIVCAIKESDLLAQLCTSQADSSAQQPVSGNSMPMPDLSHVDEPYRTRLYKLIELYYDIFRDELPKGEPPNVAPCEVVPLVPDAQPYARPSFRLSVQEMDELKKHISALLEQGLIVPSNSAWAAPAFFVDKPGGGLRCVFDYRKLNALTKKQRWPLPKISDLIDSFQGAKYFSAMDLTAGYHQVRLQPSDYEKTAVVTPFGLYEWRVCAFGLSNSPSVFQSVMNRTFQKYLNDFVLIYLDDICILSKTPEEHLLHLEKVFQTLRESKLYAKLKKCQFFKAEIKYLGHILSREGVRADPAKIAVLQQWKFPEGRQAMQQFLGLANYFRRFVPNFSRIAAPLHHLTKKTVVYSKDPVYRTAFELLKQALAAPPVLAYPDPSLPYELISDASVTGCGAVLMQDKRPVAYFSSKFCPAEVNYTTTEQELLAIIKALKEWRCYLEGCKQLTIYTDHNPLTYLPTQAMLSRRQARWMEFLSRFVFSIEHIPGKKNPADGISRLFALVSNELLTVDLPTAVRSGYASDSRFADTTFLRQHQLYQEDTFWQRFGKIVVPSSAVDAVIKAHHDLPFSGHFGMNRTYESITRMFWWPSMKSDIESYISRCHSCQQNKPSNKTPAGLLQPLPIPDTRWHTVTLDFMVRLPKTVNKFDAILVFVDKLTKMVHLVPTTTDVSAEETARLFISNVFRLHGLPSVFISDRDSKFTSHFWSYLCKALGIKKSLSSAFHPQTDGQTERTNRVVEEVLRHFCEANSRTWDSMLPIVEFALNNHKSAATGETPFFLNYGLHPMTPISVDFVPKDRIPSLDAVLHNLDATLVRVKRLLQAAQARMAAYANKSRSDVKFAVGDYVMLSTKNISLVGNKKLLPRYIGPFKIVKMINPVAAQLFLPEHMLIHDVFHVSLLRHYSGDIPDGFTVPDIPQVVDGVPFYSVERLLFYRLRKVGRKTVKEYLIKWRGYDDKHNSWEPESNITDDALAMFPDVPLFASKSDAQPSAAARKRKRV